MNQASRPLPTRTEPPAPPTTPARRTGGAEASRAPSGGGPEPQRQAPDPVAATDAGLALIGRISAGLAQELGNPLGIVAMNLGVVRTEYDRLARAGRLGPSALEPALLDLESSVVRMRSVIAHLRPFAAAPKTELASVPVADIVSRIVRWAAASLRGFDVEVCAEPLTAMADPTMLEQVVLHLTANAASAASSLPLPRLRYHVYRSGDRVVVSVRDNGPGMSSDLHEKIFEPFFTTRRSEGGTGLGLALCREYARQMDATLTVVSSPDEGACFRLSLRAPDSEAPGAAE
jgi:C4-dicarboxylate-specific signal transduction histidine kinase